ncbi:serine/threonine-protein kinase, partial [Ramlibacter sp.]|uniref:serine/threonine-protein kinase n=1 Tax=Ramlibacter sp. TaxID=1917967 RepID=UPI0025D6DE46
MSLKKLGRYELIRVLGKGAMGVVYEGRDPNLDRRVAIKTVKVENLSEEAAAEYEHRFRTEARSAARLQHPNIVSVYDSDRDGDIAFLVMEYIQGDDLKHHLDRGVRYSLEHALKMVRDLLSALDYAHKQNIVHRDVKPANLLIEPGGRVKLTDFGVARIQDSSEATRTQGSMVGTLKYMSPEQVQGQKIDTRADLFSVGVVLYQLLTDKRPFDGDNDFSIIHQIIGHSPPPSSSFNARLPAAIDAVVARALAKDREQRFATARDFASALQSAIRRAEDQTVVPPADPTRRFEPVAVGSRPGFTQPGLATNAATSPPTVTQELELVYWKDIKDSADPEELQGFLDKFPAGIYADLARRRMRRLASGASADQTVLIGMPAGRNTDHDMDATRLRTDASQPFVMTRSTGGQDTLTATQPLPGARAAALAASQAAQPVPARAAAEPAAVPAPVVTKPAPVVASSPVPAPRAAAGKKTSIAVIGGVAVIAVAAIAAFLASGRGAERAVDAAAPAASAPAPVASSVAAAPVAAPASAEAPAASATGPGSMWVVRAPASAAVAAVVPASVPKR